VSDKSACKKQFYNPKQAQITFDKRGKTRLTKGMESHDNRDSLEIREAMAMALE